MICIEKKALTSSGLVCVHLGSGYLALCRIQIGLCRYLCKKNKVEEIKGMGNRLKIMVWPSRFLELSHCNVSQVI